MTGEAYTHAMHAKACQQAANASQTLTQWVQVRTSGSSCCARILDAWTSADGQDFWKVQATTPLRFTGSYPVRSVRQCSGLDGLCICAGEAENFDATKHVASNATNSVAHEMAL